MTNNKTTEGLLNQPVNDRYNDGSDKREKAFGYQKKEIGPEQSDTPTNKPEQFGHHENHHERPSTTN